MDLTLSGGPITMVGSLRPLTPRRTSVWAQNLRALSKDREALGQPLRVVMSRGREKRGSKRPPFPGESLLSWDKLPRCVVVEREEEEGWGSLERMKGKCLGQGGHR